MTASKPVRAGPARRWRIAELSCSEGAMRAASGGALAVASPVEPGQEVTGRLVELADVVEQH